MTRKGTTLARARGMYNLLIDPHSDQYEYKIETSQIVPSNGTDRFDIVVGQLSGYGEIRYVDYKLRVQVMYNENQISSARDVNLRVYSPPHFLEPITVIGPTLDDRLAALDSLDPQIVAEVATILGATESKEAATKLLSVLKKQPDDYINFYKKEVLTKPFYRERGMPASAVLKRMYLSIFWALHQITGDFAEGAIKDMPSNARPIAKEVIDELRKSQ